MIQWYLQLSLIEIGKTVEVGRKKLGIKSEIRIEFWTC